jgi:predicted NBD/HSP70 family sugar kinase
VEDGDSQTPGAATTAGGAARRSVGSLGELRTLNRLRVVDALRREGSASRSELARLTGLSRTTVTTLVAELEGQGLVVEDAPRASHETSGRGRPPALLRLDPGAGAAVGVDFGHRHLRVAVADLASTVLAERAIALDVDHGRKAALDAARSLVDEALDEAGIGRDRVIGVGAGLPGPIDRRTGRIASAAILADWSGTQPGVELAERLGLPVELDNDANLGALGELTFGAGRGRCSLVYVKLSSGIGAGLILGGRLERGATGFAGELGHVRVRADGVVCRCGSRGCLETVAAVDALLASLRPASQDEPTLESMMELLAQGDPGTRRVLEDAGTEVGTTLAALCNALNPELIVVGGDLSEAGAPLLDGIRRALERGVEPCIAAEVEVTPSVLGERACVLGALALVIGDTEGVSSGDLPGFAVSTN